MVTGEGGILELLDNCSHHLTCAHMSDDENNYPVITAMVY